MTTAAVEERRTRFSPVSCRILKLISSGQSVQAADPSDDSDQEGDMALRSALIVWTMWI